MRYWYYSWKSTKSGDAEEGCNLSQTELDAFDLSGESRFLWGKQGVPCIINFWKEIPRRQYDAYTQFLSDTERKNEPNIKRIK